jgi:hypothetical protein
LVRQLELFSLEFIVACINLEAAHSLMSRFP